MMTCAVTGCDREASEGYRLPICQDCGWEIAQRFKERIIHEDQARREAAWDRQAREARAKQGAGEGLVYYVRIGERIKIGFTTRLRQRLSQLRLDPATALLAVEPGPPALERERHAQFAHDRIGRREDFHPSAALLEHVDRVAYEHGLPRWTRLPDIHHIERRSVVP